MNNALISPQIYKGFQTEKIDNLEMFYRQDALWCKTEK